MNNYLYMSKSNKCMTKILNTSLTILDSLVNDIQTETITFLKYITVYRNGNNDKGCILLTASKYSNPRSSVWICIHGSFCFAYSRHVWISKKKIKMMKSTQRYMYTHRWIDNAPNKVTKGSFKIKCTDIAIIYTNSILKSQQVKAYKIYLSPKLWASV